MKKLILILSVIVTLYGCSKYSDGPFPQEMKNYFPDMDTKEMAFFINDKTDDTLVHMLTTSKDHFAKGVMSTEASTFIRMLKNGKYEPGYYVGYYIQLNDRNQNATTRRKDAFLEVSLSRSGEKYSYFNIEKGNIDPFNGDGADFGEVLELYLDEMESNNPPITRVVIQYGVGLIEFEDIRLGCTWKRTGI